MYTLTKTSDTPRILGGNREAIGVFATIEEAFEHVKNMEGVSYFFGEPDEANDAGDCFAVINGHGFVFTVER